MLTYYCPTYLGCFMHWTYYCRTFLIFLLSLLLTYPNLRTYELLLFDKLVISHSRNCPHKISSAQKWTYISRKYSVCVYLSLITLIAAAAGFLPSTIAA